MRHVTADARSFPRDFVKSTFTTSKKDRHFVVYHKGLSFVANATRWSRVLENSHSKRFVDDQSAISPSLGGTRSTTMRGVCQCRCWCWCSCRCRCQWSRCQSRFRSRCPCSCSFPSPHFPRLLGSPSEIWESYDLNYHLPS